MDHLRFHTEDTGLCYACLDLALDYLAFCSLHDHEFTWAGREGTFPQLAALQLEAAASVINGLLEALDEESR